MKTKDLLYIGLVSYLAILLLKKKNTTQSTQDSQSTQSTNVNDVKDNTQTVGNASNGGLNLNQGMDLPNLTPTPENGLSTEVSLNSSNVSPLIKDNEPTQIFGLPFPAELLQHATSNINPNPIDVVAPAPVVVSTPNTNNTTYPVDTINESEGTTTSQPVYNTPRPVIATLPELPLPNNGMAEDEMPVFNTPRPIISGASVIKEPFSNPIKSVVKEEPISIYENPVGPNQPAVF